MNSLEFGEILKNIRLERGLSQEEMASLLHTSKQVISRYETGKRSPKISTVAAFASILDIPISALSDDPSSDPFTIPGIERPSWQRVPVLGAIACGTPILAEENIEEYISVDGHIKCDFLLHCKGDSMSPRLMDGDYVMIRQQPDVEDGQIAAILIDGNATLKHVYHLPGRSGVQLVADNPSFPPMIYTEETADDVRILGRAVGYQRCIR